MCITEVYAPWNEFELTKSSPERKCDYCGEAHHNMIGQTLRTELCEDCVMAIYENKMKVLCCQCNDLHDNEDGIWEEGGFYCGGCEKLLNAK